MWKILYWFTLLLFVMISVMSYFHCSKLQIPQHNNSLGKHNHMAKSQTQLSTATSFSFHIVKRCLNPCKSGNFKLYIRPFQLSRDQVFCSHEYHLSLLDKLTTLWFDKLHKHYILSFHWYIFWESTERYSSKGWLLL